MRAKLVGERIVLVFELGDALLDASRGQLRLGHFDRQLVAGVRPILA